MSFDWVDYLKLAERLVTEAEQLGPEEAFHRAATSRAYYAAFHYAMEFAEDDGYIPRRSGDDHVRVPAHFRTATDKQRKQIFSKLDRLRKHRSMADYDNEIRQRTPRVLSDMAVKDANHIVELIDELHDEA